VAATDIYDTRAGWSSYRPEVDIAAPGVSITSAEKGGGYTTASGTSAASPHVAGTLALNLSDDLFGAAAVPPAGPDNYTGVGLVDAGEASTSISNYGDDLP
jgi:subtilisin family serine protease